MEGLERAKLKDRILQFLLDNPTGHYDAENFYLKLGKPVNSISHMQEIVDEIKLEAPKWVRSVRTDVFDLLTCNDFTKEFLENGGFVSEYNNQLEAAQRLNEAAKRENKVKELHEVELKLKIRNNKYALPLSILSIAIALASLLITIFKPKPEKLNDEQLKAIQKRMDYLEGTLVKENDSMRLEIDKIKDTIE